MNKIDLIMSSENLKSINQSHILPEPYDTEGYFYFYYVTKDYKEALSDIVEMINKDIRIFYDRKLEFGPAWEDNLLSKIKSFSCRAVIFYLSNNVIEDPLFWKILSLVNEKHIYYASINLLKDNNSVLMPEDIIKTFVLEDEQKALFHKMFNKDITFIPFNISLDDKIKGISSIGSNDPLIYNYYQDGRARIIGVKNFSEEHISIPEKVEYKKQEYIVDAIGPSAFRNCTRLKSIDIPNTIKYFGTASISNNIPSITEGMVFDKCEKLEEVIVPDSVEEFCLNNFSGCKNLKKVVLGNGIKVLKGYNGRFELINEYDYREDDESLYVHMNELVLPPSFEIINNNYYFHGVNGYKAMELYEIDSIKGAKEINPIKEYINDGKTFGERFINDSIIEKIDLTILESEQFTASFSNCSNLKELILPKNAKIINIDCSGCYQLEKIIIGENTEEIEELILSDCANLTTITIPNKINHFNMEELSYIPNLQVVVLDNKNAYDLLKPISDVKMAFMEPNRPLRQKIFYPLIVWFSFFLMIFSKYFFIAILCFVFFPISVPIMMLKKKYDPTKHLHAPTIYVKDYKKRIKIKRYKKIISDKEGYLLFVKR